MSEDPYRFFNSKTLLMIKKSSEEDEDISHINWHLKAKKQNV